MHTRALLFRPSPHAARLPRRPQTIFQNHENVFRPGQTFTNDFLVPFWRKFEAAIRGLSDGTPPDDIPADGFELMVFAEPIIDFADPASHPTPRLPPPLLLGTRKMGFYARSMFEMSHDEGG